MDFPLDGSTCAAAAAAAFGIDAFSSHKIAQPLHPDMVLVLLLVGAAVAVAFVACLEVLCVAACLSKNSRQILTLSPCSLSL